MRPRSESRKGLAASRHLYRCALQHGYRNLSQVIFQAKTFAVMESITLYEDDTTTQHGFGFLVEQQNRPGCHKV